MKYLDAVCRCVIVLPYKKLWLIVVAGLIALAMLVFLGWSVGQYAGYAIGGYLGQHYARQYLGQPKT